MTTLFSPKVQVTQTDVNFEPRKSLLMGISTFKELDEYITVLTSVLDYIERFAGHPYFSDYFGDSIFKIIKNDHGTNGYDLKLIHKGIGIACVGYYRLDQSDNIWVRCYYDGHTHINAFQHDEHENVIEYQCSTGAQFDVLPYNIDDYNESMYDQLEFVYPKEQVNTIMCIAKLDASDSARKHRQFSIYEGCSDDYYKVLEELKEWIKLKEMNESK